MRKNRFKLIPVRCPRCGKEVYTGNRSLWGADQVKAKYQGICSSCITPEEKAEMMQELSEAVYLKVRNP